MKIAIVSFYEAYPPVSGAASVTYNLAKFLSGERLLVQIGARAATSESSDGLRIITLARAPANRIGRFFQLHRQVRAIVRELLHFRPDCVIFEGASWAVYHWLLLRSIRWAAPNVPIIYHAHNVEYLLRRARNGRAIAAFTRRAEGWLLAQCNLATAVSDLDRAHFRELYNVDTVLLPNGVDVARFASVSPGDTERMRLKYHIRESAVIFSGMYAYPPNRAAVDFLREYVMPRLIERIPCAQLVITGGEVPQAEPWLVSAGVVPYETLPALLTACKAAAVPLFSGSGTRLKILEAMAAGVPVVATEKAVEGLGLLHRKHFLLANNQQEFVNAIAAVFETPPLATNLRSSAEKRVKAGFSWQAIARDFEQAIIDLTGTDSYPEGLSSFGPRETRQ